MRAPSVRRTFFLQMPESDTENEFYCRSIELLQKAKVPFLLGGAFAFCVYTGIVRRTKDFDLFVRPTDLDRVLDVFRRAGYRAEKTFPHWLSKAFSGDETIDIIFRAGNGLSTVDDLWFDRARVAEVFGYQVPVCPAEEMIWMKAFIMERERFDGADVAHLFFHCGPTLDWDHLLTRFGPDWRVLLAHIVLFGFIFPDQRARIPSEVSTELLGRFGKEEGPAERICYGTLISRAQYLTDLRQGYRDARLEPRVGLSQSEIDAWTEAVDESVKPHRVARDD